MSTKNIKTRIKQNHKIEKQWNNEQSFTPLDGELIVYDSEVDQNGNNITGQDDFLPAGRATGYNYPRIKIGDGISSVSDLQFLVEELSDAAIVTICEQPVLINAEEVRF